MFTSTDILDKKQVIILVYWYRNIITIIKRQSYEFIINVSQHSRWHNSIVSCFSSGNNYQARILWFLCKFPFIISWSSHILLENILFLHLDSCLLIFLWAYTLFRKLDFVVIDLNKDYFVFIEFAQFSAQFAERNCFEVINDSFVIIMDFFYLSIKEIHRRLWNNLV